MYPNAIARGIKSHLYTVKEVLKNGGTKEKGIQGKT